MSGWFQRTPDPPRKKQINREHSLEKQKSASRLQPQASPSLAAKGSTSSEGSRTPTGFGSAGKHAPLSASKSSPSSNSSSSPTTSPERALESSGKVEKAEANSAKLEELQKEIQRLKDNEISLSKKLALEKEQRIHAEQLVEVERLAFHEMQLRLHLEERSHRYSNESKVQEDKTINSEEVDSPDTNYTETPIDLGESEGPEKSSYSIESFSPISAEFNFSTSIFGQLTNDLQKILRVGQSEEPQAKSVFSRALDAVKSGNSSELMECVQSLRKEDGLPLLKLAAEKGHSSCLRTLLGVGKFDPSISNANGVTPLHAAAMHGQTATAEVLLEHHAQIDATDTEGYTPLFLALRERHSKTAGMLIKAGASLDVISNSGQTLLHAAVMGHLPGALHSILVRLRVHCSGGSKVRDLITHRDDDYRTALHIAASRGLKTCTEILCATGDVDVTQRDRWNCTPIEVATGDTKEILVNKDSKSIILYVEISSSSISPTITHNTSYDLTEEDDQEEGKEENFSLAIGNLNILRHHTFSDLEFMVNSSLHNFCSYINLKGTHSSHHNSANGCASSPRFNWEDKINLGLVDIASRKYQIGRCFLPLGSEMEGRGDGSISDPSVKENIQEAKSKRMAYTEECKSVLKKFASKLSEMEFTDQSVLSYSIGKYCWRAGMLPNSLRSKNLFALLSELSSSGSETSPGIHVTLRGANESELDQLSLELMMPMKQIRECIDILEHEKKLLIHGPHGNGKAHLARKLGRYLQTVHGEKQTQVINVYVDEAFERDDLFRLFHSNHLLIPAMSEGIKTAKKSSSSPFKRHVLILNHLSSASYPGLMSHIISLLESREAELSLWVNEVANRYEEGKGKPDVPGGLYYMKEDCFIIGTWTSAGGNTSLPPAIMDHFPHISMGTASALCCGVLRRQLLSASIHCANGVWPHLTQPLYRLMQWVGDIWILYNKLLADLGLAYAPTALKHFLSCPVNSLTPETDIPQWLITTWRYHIVPSVQSVLQDYFNQESTSTLMHQILSSIIGLAIMPTCPLSDERRDEVVQALCHNIEEYCMATSRPTPPKGSLVGETPGNSPPLFHSYHSSPSSIRKLSPLLGQRRGSLQSLNSPTLGRKGILQRGSPLINQRRGSWNDLRSTQHVTFEKPGKLVSYEDMVKNSPRLKEKFKKIKEEADSETVNPVTTISISPPEDSLKYDGHSSPETPSTNEKEDSERDVKSPTKEVVGNTLRKLRSKTISLFSRDGTGTLPRLFRRGSRAPLTSVTEEDPKLPFHAATMRHTSLPTPSQPLPKNNNSNKKPEFTRSLDDSNLSVAFLATPPSGTHYKNRRTPPPPPLPVQDGGGADVMKETMDTTEALQDLDNFLDLLTATPNDRIDKQRGSLPNDLQSCSEDTGSDDGDEGNVNVPRYYLPTTSSPWQQKCPRRFSAGPQSSQPAFSMPNLSVDSTRDYHEVSLPKNVQKQSPSSSSSSSNPTSQQFLTSEQPSPDEPAGRMVYIQSSQSPRAGEEVTVQQHQEHQMKYSKSGGYDVPSKHHHSFHSRHTQNPHSYQRQHQQSLPHKGKNKKPARQLQEAADQAQGGRNWWDTNGGVSSQEDGFLSPSKKMVDGDGRSPSPLAMTSYSSNEARAPDSKYFTYHAGRHKRAELQDNFHRSSGSGGSGQGGKRRVHSPQFREGSLDQGDIYNGEDMHDGCNSPIGRLDVWSDHRKSEDEAWTGKERTKSLSHKTPQRYQKDRGGAGNSTTIPPPLDILKKRTSASVMHYNEQSHSRESSKRRSESTGSIPDFSKEDSISDLSSPNTLASGTLFGASLGFLGSSGSLNDIHAKM